MIESKHINKIVIGIAALALLAVLLVYVFADQLAGLVPDGGKTMEYESALFDTGQVMEVDIQIDEEDWQELLDNALDEEYYACDVTVNGEDYVNVGLRAKGNTSLSSIANDEDTDRYSFKIEFDQYVDNQNCCGLDKLILNNNFSDATMMKEYLTYDMFQYLGADSSLFNYAEVSVNGEYWGVYLALEAVEESFAQRNYGVDHGELYKPESMGVGGAGKMREFDTEDLQELQEMMEQRKEAAQEDTAGATGADTDATGIAGATGDAADMADISGEADGTGGGDSAVGPQWSNKGEGGSQAGEQPGGDAEAAAGAEAGEGAMEQPGGGGMPGGGGGMPGGGMSGGGTDLNYIDDELDSYSTIWESSVFETGDKDHKRVIEALKSISQQNELETYMDVDNMLKYLAVQTFVVNLDGLAGNMTHNYYLYEDDGQLNLIPWDYNLAFGGFQSGSASTAVNFPIDTPFSTGLEDREFFAGLLENPDYLEQYHEYLRQLCEEYVYGGELEETYEQARQQIDALVETDPTSFYTYEEYEAAAEMLLKVTELRADSVLGQLDGSIPATTEGQQADSTALIDTTGIDLSVMGSMMGGGGNRGEAPGDGAGGFEGMAPPEGFPGGPPSQGREESDAQSTPGAEGAQQGEPQTSGAGDETAQRPDDGGREAMPGFETQSTLNMTTVYYTAGSFALILAVIAAALLYRRKKKK